MHMWQWKNEQNYLEKKTNLSSIVICYSDLHYSQRAALALILECYATFIKRRLLWVPFYVQPMFWWSLFNHLSKDSRVFRFCKYPCQWIWVKGSFSKTVTFSNWHYFYNSSDKKNCGSCPHIQENSNTLKYVLFWYRMNKLWVFYGIGQRPLEGPSLVASSWEGLCQT